MFLIRQKNGWNMMSHTNRRVNTLLILVAVSLATSCRSADASRSFKSPVESSSYGEDLHSEDPTPQEHRTLPLGADERHMSVSGTACDESENKRRIRSVQGFHRVTSHFLAIAPSSEPFDLEKEPQLLSLTELEYPFPDPTPMYYKGYTFFPHHIEHPELKVFHFGFDLLMGGQLYSQIDLALEYQIDFSADPVQLKIFEAQPGRIFHMYPGVITERTGALLASVPLGQAYRFSNTDVLFDALPRLYYSRDIKTMGYIAQALELEKPEFHHKLRHHRIKSHISEADVFVDLLTYHACISYVRVSSSLIRALVIPSDPELKRILDSIPRRKDAGEEYQIADPLNKYRHRNW